MLYWLFQVEEEFLRIPILLALMALSCQAQQVAGPKTERAVRAFQADNPPLTVDGICGLDTKAKLKQLLGG